MGNESINTSWASSLPVKQGLYDPELEKDACGVGFSVQIKGEPSHKIVSDAKTILCNMTHRGATGADFRDGDGAGVMTSMPHEFLVRECQYINVKLPSLGEYATGNLFFHPEKIEKQKSEFEGIASSLNLKVLGWREVPVDSMILGPVSKSKEPSILQPFVIHLSGSFDSKQFVKNLYLLRKIASHQIGLREWFYICSLSTHNITYKGQLSPVQVYDYFLDLGHYLYKGHFALVHSRFSTNTFPSWNRAQPMRFCAHNGEINTLRGNKNWMRAREGIMKSTFFQNDLDKLYPIIEEGGSDSAAFDNVLELLLMNGTLTLPECIMMMVPEAWQNNPHMDSKKKDFYRWAACLMEPWDGPALFTFSDGRYVGASLDRNGLRPCRYVVTDDDRMICASEVGTIAIESKIIVKKGRLQPGRMLLVDTELGKVVDDTELKQEVANKQEFGKWIKRQMLTLTDLKQWNSRSGKPIHYTVDPTPLFQDLRMNVFGFTLEQLNLLLLPMVKSGKEALGSMGNDNALACLSKQSRPIYEYFRQLFAQVTNPPIDPIREDIVMSLECYVGPEGNILTVDETQCHKLLLPSPILDIAELESIKNLQNYVPDWPVVTVPITFIKKDGLEGYRTGIQEVIYKVAKAIQQNIRIVILSDADVDAEHVPLSALIALGAVHQYLVRNRQRSKVALIVETGEAREVHHHCVLLGYGADAICPYLAIDSILKLKREGLVDPELTNEKLIDNYKTATNNGILKVMSKMGISTLQSYKGAQIFEALGIGEEVIDRCFSGTASRIKGATFELFAQDALRRHETAYPTRDSLQIESLPEIGEYHWRKGGDEHINEPASIGFLQDAVRNKNMDAYTAYAQTCHQQIKHCTLRGLLDFDFNKAKPVPLDEVEAWTEIVKRFCTGAMSYGSISYEAHTTLAAAMNQLGGKSNTGEGGEDPKRSTQLIDGKDLRSAIKQVASGRFGVTSFYLTNADELQIKMAQGAKPGEGGELPGHKVSQTIADTRKSTKGVGLISPPPHHDIYSIEDLKQLIYDLKTANPRSRVSVKLVSEVGVGIVASGVAKAKADHILISGHDGGTGASRWTGIKYAGLPWELGLAETHQTLVLNDLRGRVVLQTDGQIKTGRDVALACLLGAEEWGFATTPLIAMGCTMMRKCLQSNTLVKTTDGVKSVAKVKVGDFLINGDGLPVMCIGALEPMNGKLKLIMVGEDVEFKCTPDHHLALVATNCQPKLEGNRVSWFSKCQPSTDVEEFEDNLNNFNFKDSNQNNQFEPVAIDQHYHRGNSKSTKKLKKSQLGKSNEQSWFKRTQEALQLGRERCSCQGFQQITTEFETYEEAEQVYELLGTDGYFRVDSGLVRDNERMQLSVEDYEKVCQPQLIQQHLKMYLGEDESFEEKNSLKDELPLDPYFLGLLLACSTSDGCIVTDQREVMVYINSYLQNINATLLNKTNPLVLKQQADRKFGEANKYKIGFQFESEAEIDPVQFTLTSLGFSYGSKIVPEIYLQADLQVKYKVLAGILDGSATYNKESNGYKVVFEEFELVQSTVILTESCGINADQSIHQTSTNLMDNTVTEKFILNLNDCSSQLNNYVQLPHNKPNFNKKYSSDQLLSFHIEDCDDDQFRAIEVSGGSFQLSNSVVVHNCHLNTCPVGIATQDSQLRKKFAGQPEHVVNFFYYVAEEMRALMAALGFRTVNEMVGRADLLKVDLPKDNVKASSLDLTNLLQPAHLLRPNVATFCVRKQDHKLHTRLDNKLIAESELAITKKHKVSIDAKVVNTDRTIGSTLSYNVSRAHGEAGLPENTIQVNLKGSAGQSFGAFLASGITLELEGDSNDYVGKGLSGGILVVYPPKDSSFPSETNILVGNVCLYGATSGQAYFRGVAAERFAVRNSGAHAVVEGCGDHGCEYMTGGRVVILGETGRNFAAGMSGGIAYIYDPNNRFQPNCNMEMVELETIETRKELAEVKELIHQHFKRTGSTVAYKIYQNFDFEVQHFVKVIPTDYKQAMQELEKQKLIEALEKPTPKVHQHHDSLADIEDLSPTTDLNAQIKVVDKVQGFVKYRRQADHYRDAKSRLKDWKEVNRRLTKSELKVQAARCMDCGVPFCQSNTGCPIGNIIPKWNDLVYHGRWKEALDKLMLTNNFPEFTGRVCPAPCEGSCVLGINEAPVSIKSIECAIIDKGFEEGWIQPNPPKSRTGYKVAVIGSGPAGLAAADQLNKAGHLVTVYDRNDRAGGLLMYGIPNMKLDKKIVQRRIDLLQQEGIEFVLNCNVGKDITFQQLQSSYDIVLMATGATWPRDLNIPNRQLDGIHFAMDFLQANTKALLDNQLTDKDSYLSAKDKKVIVIGGGDTGCDCIGTSARHGAASITNFELLPQPPQTRAEDNPWPQYPKVFKLDYGHDEVKTNYNKDPRQYQILSKSFLGANGKVTGIETVQVSWERDSNNKWVMTEVPGSENTYEADLILLAMGFLGPESNLVKQANLKTTRTSNIETKVGCYKTSADKVFAAGDARRGQSLIVWAINEGRQAARQIDQHLMQGSTYLPVTGGLVEISYLNEVEKFNSKNKVKSVEAW